MMDHLIHLYVYGPWREIHEIAWLAVVLGLALYAISLTLGITL